MTDDEIIDSILNSEGNRFTDDPDDAGGPTKFGVTLKTLSVGLRMLLGRPTTVEDVKNLTEAQARHIYQLMFIQGPGFYKINDGMVKLLAVDSGTHHGPKRAIDWLQEIVGVQVDGILGPKTEEAINKADATMVYKRLLARRVRFMGALIEEKRRQAKYAGGWFDRAARFIEM